MMKPKIIAVLDVPFPDELIGSRAIIQGASGAGKTYAIRRILEAAHGRKQHIVSMSRTSCSHCGNATTTC